MSRGLGIPDRLAIKLQTNWAVDAEGDGVGNPNAPGQSAREWQEEPGVLEVVRGWSQRAA